MLVGSVGEGEAEAVVVVVRPGIFTGKERGALLKWLKTGGREP